MAHYILNVRRLLCPLPVIRAQERIKQLQPGDTLEVICTDPGCLHDVPAWCRVHGHTVLASSQQGQEIFITLQVRE